MEGRESSDALVANIIKSEGIIIFWLMSLPAMNLRPSKRYINLVGDWREGSLNVL